jgi:hypothetical protein
MRLLLLMTVSLDSVKETLRTRQPYQARSDASVQNRSHQAERSKIVIAHGNVRLCSSVQRVFCDRIEWLVLSCSVPGHVSSGRLQDWATGGEDTMALLATRSAGMIVLAIYLIVVGLAGLVALAVPLAVTAVLALLAGVLILIGR